MVGLYEHIIFGPEMNDSEKSRYIEGLGKLFRPLKHEPVSLELPNGYTAHRYIFETRMVDLVFRNHGRLARAYLLNTELGTPTYKDTGHCYTSEMLDLISGTTARSFKRYFGENLPDGIYTRTQEQAISDMVGIFSDNFQAVRGVEWPSKHLIDSLYSTKMGFKTTAGWEPDPQLVRLKNELSFLLTKGFELVEDSSELPEYEG